MGNADAAYSLYSLTEEHQLLRKMVRQLAEDVIAPRAAEIDEAAEYPWDVHEALKKADLLAIHVPEEYGGAGADLNDGRARHRQGDDIDHDGIRD